MKIIQITDLHIDDEGSYPFDIDVRKNFLRILSHIKKQKPDHLVVSGDLCYREPIEEIKEWIKEVLDFSDLEYSVIAGNHDDSTMMARVFNFNHLLNEEELYYAKKIGKETVLFLDSARGFLSKKQSNWLQRQLKNATDDVIIFMHHPPIKAGVPFMDSRYPMQHLEKVQQIFFDHPANIHVFCGHYHLEKTIRQKNLSVHITPSCFFQIDHHSLEFKVDHHRIGYREIQLDNQVLMSTVRYFNGSKK
ncbi:MAG: Icc protein [Saprospiraceae bacterium]|jgi:Icc protein